MKHCLVTPEIVHLHRNGGVGTNSYYLAQFLSQIAKRQVTILYTGPMGPRSERWKEVFARECGAEFFSLEETVPELPVTAVDMRQLADSQRVYSWLKRQDFDVVHFQHYEAAGFCSLQAKRLGEAFQNTHLVTIGNGPTAWSLEVSEQFPGGHVFEMMLDHMERYCVEHCDTFVSPSQRLIDWMRTAGWTLPREVRHLPTYMPRPEPFPVPPLDPRHLVFFGRLEKRKGLELFTAAVRQLVACLPADRGPLRVTFLGHASDEARAFLSAALFEMPPHFSWEIHGEFGHLDVLAFFKENASALFVHASPRDNFPNAVQETVLRGLHQLCAMEPGAEFFGDSGRLFEPSVAGLLQKFLEVFTLGLPPLKTVLDPEQATANRLRFLHEIEQQSTSSHPKTGVHVGDARPLVSVCVPFFNLGKYLPETLAALAVQTYSNYEVIVVDDGSTHEDSRRVFAQMEAHYTSRAWKFFRRANGGVSEARNFAVKHASGTFLAFVDADNLPFPGMVEGMVARLLHADLDGLTCHLHGFADGQSAAPEHLQLLWMFLGGCVETALRRNNLGDTNMLVRRKAFESVGGFQNAPEEAAEDLAFLARLVIAGFQLDCTSEPLFAYRRRPDSMSQTANAYRRHISTLRAITETLPPWTRRLITNQFKSESRIQESQAKNRGLATVIEEWKQKAQALEAQLHDSETSHQTEHGHHLKSRRAADARYETLRRLRRSPYVRFGRFLGIVKFEA